MTKVPVVKWATKSCSSTVFGPSHPFVTSVEPLERKEPLFEETTHFFHQVAQLKQCFMFLSVILSNLQSLPVQTHAYTCTCIYVHECIQVSPTLSTYLRVNRDVQMSGSHKFHWDTDKAGARSWFHGRPLGASSPSNNLEWAKWKEGTLKVN